MSVNAWRVRMTKYTENSENKQITTKFRLIGRMT